VTALDVREAAARRGANPEPQLKRRPPYRDVPQDRGGDTILRRARRRCCARARPVTRRSSSCC
jgi:hypothetical protein